jgi:hypothetical protein
MKTRAAVAAQLRSIFGDALDPVDRLTEIFSGLVMVLAVTLLAGHDVASGPAGVRSLLRAALGGNFAWGIIDGVVYLMTQRYQRRLRAQQVAAVRGSSDDAATRASVEKVIDRQLVAPMTPDETSRVFSTLHLLAGRLKPVSPHLRRDDLLGALACCCLCVGSALPAAVPFLIFDEPMVALRVSNGVSLASLFVHGMIWGKQIGSSRLLTGLGLLLLGAALVGLQLAFGG